LAGRGGWYRCPTDKPRIVIVGAGFAGFHAARRVQRLAKSRAEIILVNPTDYFLYSDSGRSGGDDEGLRRGPA
jgi:NADPH-dependent 2,4-dienoyl-CoA reductase/sulfur reductase-like enzyme